MVIQRLLGIWKRNSGGTWPADTYEDSSSQETKTSSVLKSRTCPHQTLVENRPAPGMSHCVQGVGIFLNFISRYAMGCTHRGVSRSVLTGRAQPKFPH